MKTNDYGKGILTNNVGSARSVMSANDEIVLKTNFEDWKQRIADIKGIDPWLYYCVEQFVKPYALDDEEIRYGITDGGNDGGADGIYFLVNQSQLVTEDAVLDAKNVSKIRLMIIQCKHSGGFKPTEIEKWIEFSDDFFDLSKPADSFGTRYNDCKNNEDVEGEILKGIRGFSGHNCGVFLHNRGQFVSGQLCRRFRTSCHRQGREAH